MFVSTPQNNVIAINAKTGSIIWRYARELPAEMQQLHPTNRGVALYGDKVYMSTMDACVVALKAATGEVVWDKCVIDWNEGYYSTLAPLAAKGKILTGVSGGELGIRGFVAALDAETGEQVWKTYTVPGPGEPGSETWKGDAWKTGGAPVWMQGNFDPKTGLAYFGTGNGGPWMPDARPGDNLYATSALAIDVDTGKIKGHHQYQWNDAWDWDEVSAPLLVDVEHDGKTVPALAHAGRDGYLWTLERTPDGPINFIAGQPFVHQDVFKSLDPKTGRPSYNEDKIPGTGKKALFCPSLWGGKDWPNEAYNPKTKLLYIPANDNLCAELSGQPVGEYEPGSLYIGVPIEDIFSSMRPREGVDTSKPMKIGQMQAWDLSTRQEGVEPRLRGHRTLGTGSDHGRQSGLRRRHQRPHVPRLRRQDRQDPLAVAAELRRARRADLVRDRRRAVHRRAGRVRRRHRAPEQRPDEDAGTTPRQPEGADRRHGLGVRPARQAADRQLRRGRP